MAMTSRILNAFFMFPNLAESPGQFGKPERCDTIGVVMVVFAHGSGIDDVLWFLVPVILALVVLRRAEKRASKSASESDSVEAAPSRSPER